MNRRFFLRAALGVLGAMAVGGRALADPVPQGMEVVSGNDHQDKARMACLSNPRLRKMVYKYNHRVGELDLPKFYRRLRGLIHKNPEHYQYLASKGWVAANPEAQLAAMWVMDKEWGYR